MEYIVRQPWDLPQRLHTPESVYQNRRQHRREFLAWLGRGAAGLGAGALLVGCNKGTDDDVRKAGAYSSQNLQPGDTKPDTSDGTWSGALPSPYPAKRNARFVYGRDETIETAAARYTNFYEFTGPFTKESWRFVGDFKPDPWKIEIDGLCAKPRTFDMDDLYKTQQFEERHYRHRCVETWAMCVPWTGFPLRDLLQQVEPLPEAKYVALETFNRPDEAPHMGDDPSYPWPYTEGLTLAEATNELAFIATGIYGHPLPKQHGAPVRLVLPWKYGFKSIKSIVKITLTAKQPRTFWNTISPVEYDFQANVNPDVPHPRWSQRTEWMLGTRERHETILYNGYGDYVAGMYRT